MYPIAVVISIFNTDYRLEDNYKNVSRGLLKTNDDKRCFEGNNKPTSTGGDTDFVRGFCAKRTESAQNRHITKLGSL